MNFTHSLECNVVNVGNTGNELSTYSCMRNNMYIFLNVISNYMMIKTCNIGLEVLDQSPNHEKISD